jgi:hypothetical protein
MATIEGDGEEISMMEGWSVWGNSADIRFNDSE